MSRMFGTTPGTPAKNYNHQSPMEKWVLESPDYYTAFSFRGRGNSVKTEGWPTLAAAREDAHRLRRDSDRPVMIYAVRGGRDAYVEAVE